MDGLKSICICIQVLIALYKRPTIKSFVKRICYKVSTPLPAASVQLYMRASADGSRDEVFCLRVCGCSCSCLIPLTMPRRYWGIYILDAIPL